MPQRLAHKFEAVEGADVRKYVCGVGALSAARFEQPEIATPFQQDVEQELLRSPLDQSATELTEDGVVEAGIGELKCEGVLPVDAGANGGGLAIREVLGELEDRGQGEPPG